MITLESLQVLPLDALHSTEALTCQARRQTSCSLAKHPLHVYWECQAAQHSVPGFCCKAIVAKATKLARHRAANQPGLSWTFLRRRLAYSTTTMWQPPFRLCQELQLLPVIKNHQRKPDQSSVLLCSSLEAYVLHYSGAGHAINMAICHAISCIGHHTPRLLLPSRTTQSLTAQSLTGGCLAAHCGPINNFCYHISCARKMLCFCRCF